MKEQTIIGAGLSGLVAAISLARRGYSVHVRERRSGPGGAVTAGDIENEVLMVADGTPIDLEAMERYTGVDLSPVAVPFMETTVHAYGRTFRIETAPQVQPYLFERGPRESSLDHYLYRVAVDEGVEFSFDDAVMEEEFAGLEPGTIVATGFFKEALKGLERPEVPVFVHLACQETDRKDTEVILYLDEFTRDYAFYMVVGGLEAAILPQRQWPLTEEAKRRFVESLRENDGIEFDRWMDVDLASVVHRTYHAPRLFWRDFILAGTLAGCHDPLMWFGVHAALLSGRVAALAVEEPYFAQREFDRLNLAYPVQLTASYIYRYCPRPVLKHLIWVVLGLYPYYDSIMGNLPFYFLVPGFGRI